MQLSHSLHLSLQCLEFHEDITMDLQCLISSYFSRNSLLSNFHTPIPSRKVYSIFEWSITLLVSALHQMINLQKKIFKMLLEIQNDLKGFYRSNDPESVLAFDSKLGIGTREDGGEPER